MQRALITGTGSALPQNIVTNHDLAQRVDTSHAWIVKRTGIHQRHVATPEETTSTLGTIAAKNALEMANIAPADIDMIICATVSGDLSFPSTASRIQAALGMPACPAFDIQAACAGFVYALTQANAFIQAGLYKRILVIGAETFSRLLDWEDRNTCVLFGDGAGAVVLEAQESDARGILSTYLTNDGQYEPYLKATGGISTTQTAGITYMEGREVFRHAVGKLSDAATEALKRANIPSHAVDWFVPHQANLRIIDAMANHLDIPMERVILTVDQHANTAAASIPLALDVANRAGKFEAGQTLLLDALGAGFAWGAVALRW